MKKTLYGKLILGYLLYGVVSFLCIYLLIAPAMSARILDSEGKKLYASATGLAAEYEDETAYRGGLDKSITDGFRLVSAFSGSTLWITGPNGIIIYDTENRNSGKMIPEFDPSGKEAYTVGTMGGIFPESMLSAAAPVNSDFQTLGYLILSMPVNEVNRQTASVLNLLYIAAAVIYVLSFVILLIFNSTVYRPLKKISRAADEYAKGNLSYRIKAERSGDEMEYLSDTLNYMAEEQMNLEKYQRDFISNVSHDFRSPLTSIKGYLEAILDGTIPEELHEKYLRRVIGQTERLNKLTEEMLTLGNLDSKGLLQRSVFDINRMIKEVCEANENRCREKKLRFELLFEQPVEKVYADYDKIQRVLYNLVDNAVKFSYPESAITISATVDQKKVYVSVRDRGVGIPRKSIKKIWERFYKTDASRGKDQQGTGLGLAIVREIITAHNETIDVVSTEKVGTEFTFSLPQAENTQRAENGRI